MPNYHPDKINTAIRVAIGLCLSVIPIRGCSAKIVTGTTPSPTNTPDAEIGSLSIVTIAPDTTAVGCPGNPETIPLCKLSSPPESRLTIKNDTVGIVFPDDNDGFRYTDSSGTTHILVTFTDEETGKLVDMWIEKKDLTIHP